MSVKVWLVFRVTPAGERAGRLGRVIAINQLQALEAARHEFAGTITVVRKSEYEADQRDTPEESA